MRNDERFNKGHLGKGLLILLSLILGAAALGSDTVQSYPSPSSLQETTAKLEPAIAASARKIGAALKMDEPSAPSATTPWRVHFYAAPGSDGTSLFVSTGQTTELVADVNADLTVGGAPRGSFGMTYNTGEMAYETWIGSAFNPGPSTTEGTLALSAEIDDDETLDTGYVPFRRFYVPTTGAAPIVATDNNLEMLLSDYSLEVDAYVLVMSSNVLPGPTPLGHRLIGQPYSVRASGAIVTSTKPMLLKLFYTDTTLGDVDAHTLSVMQWDPVARKWDDLGGNLDDAIEHSVSTTTGRFTVYTLMSTPCWRDGFNDFTGLSDWEGVTVLLPDGELMLNGLVYTGTATTRPITPTVSIESWGRITFTSTVPGGTSLTVDVLGADGTPLLSGVASGTDLSSIDPVIYSSLKLRATFLTDDLANSASMKEWSITWQPKLYRVYLPIVLKRQDR